MLDDDRRRARGARATTSVGARDGDKAARGVGADDGARASRARDARAVSGWTTRLAGCFGHAPRARGAGAREHAARADAPRARASTRGGAARDDGRSGAREWGRASESATAATSSDASTSGSGRDTDYGIDRKTYRFNRVNGVTTNHALLLWLKRREMWTNPGRRRARDDGESRTRRSIPKNASYESFLGVNGVRGDRAFKTPIPLREMVEFLNQCWDAGEGL